MDALQVNPYPGLRPFERDEAQFFFGREQSVHRVMQRLASHDFVAIVGRSGIGKSSLVRAGLLPALAAGALNGGPPLVAIMRPGSDPVDALADAVAAALGGEFPFLDREAGRHRDPQTLFQIIGDEARRRNASCLLVVDQFEEIFRYVSQSGVGADNARAFVAALLRSISSHCRVVITMRADFVGECARFFGLPDAMNDGQYLLPPLTRAELVKAVNRPALVTGAVIEDSLSERMVDDVTDDPDQLALMQHTLHRLWRWAASRREAPLRLTLGDYEAVGTVAHSLALEADEAYSELDERQRQIAESLFRLVTEKGVSGFVDRRPILIDEISRVTGASVDEIARTVRAFSGDVRHLLVAVGGLAGTSPHTVVDISHEVLLRRWPRLTSWIDSEAESAMFYRGLVARQQEWQRGGGYLAGPLLTTATAWAAREQPTTAWASRYAPDEAFALVMSFIEESTRQAVTNASPKARRRDKIFLSYRREDSSHAAARIHDRLVGRFGKDRIFYDVDTIPSGVDFRHFIMSRLQERATARRPSRRSAPPRRS